MFNIRNLLAGLLCILISLPVRAASTETEKVGIVIECDSISKLLTDLDTVSKVIGVTMPKAKRMQDLSAMFSCPDLSGIDTNKPLQSYIILSAGKTNAAATGPDAQPAVLVLPLTDKGDTYLKSVARTYTKSEKIGSIQHFSQPTTETPGVVSGVYVGTVDGKAVLGPDRKNVELVISQLGTLEKWKARFSGVSGTLRLGIDIPAVLPSIEQSMLEATRTMQQAPAQPGMPAMNLPQLMSAEANMLVAVLRQLQSYAIGIGVSSKAIELYSILSPASTSALGGMIRDLKAPSAEYLASMPTNSCISIIGNGMNTCDAFIDDYCELFDKLCKALGPETAKIAPQMKELFASMKGLFVGDYAISVLPTSDHKNIGLVEVVAVKDANKTRKIMVDSANLTSQMYSKLSPGMTISNDKPRTVNGVEVLRYTYAVAPTNMGTQVGAMQAGLLGTFRTETAFPDGKMIYTMGAPALMDEALARVKTGGARIDNSKAFTALFPGLQEKVVAIHSLEIVKLIKSFLASTPNGEAMLAMIPDSNSGIAGYTTVRGNDLVTITRAGFDEITGIKNSAPALGLMLLPMMMNAQGAGQDAPPADTNAKCINNLRMIDAAKEQCALEKRLNDGDAVSPMMLSKYLLRGKMPTCPAGGVYNVNPIGKNPTCSVPGHKLE